MNTRDTRRAEPLPNLPFYEPEIWTFMCPHCHVPIKLQKRNMPGYDYREERDYWKGVAERYAAALYEANKELGRVT